MDQISLNNLDNLRITVQQFLNTQRLSASNIVTVRRNTRPARLLSFDYYGTSENATSIIDINNNINVSYFSGDIKVLTE